MDGNAAAGELIRRAREERRLSQKSCGKSGESAITFVGRGRPAAAAGSETGKDAMQAQVMARMGAERFRLCRRGAAAAVAAALVVVAGASAVGGAGKAESALFSPRMLWTYVTGGPALSGYSRAMTQYRLLLERSLGSIGVAGLINPADYGDARWTWRAETAA